MSRREYDHSQITTFTLPELEAFVGYKARLPLTGRIVEARVGDSGPFVLFKPDERWGFEIHRLGVDMEALDRVYKP